MKRHGSLWPQITDFENLLLASRKAQKAKRFRDNVLAFNYHLETELLTLQQELTAQTYQPGPYRNFEIFEPKRRLISAAPYRDRVVHHALCNVMVPLLDPMFIDDCYANRTGYGSHRALRRFTRFARSSKYVLQCDISKYFPSIDIDILKGLVRRKIKCPETLWLIDVILDSCDAHIPAVFHFEGDDLLTPLARQRGLPIGNLTSQFFANVYLNGFDHYVKETLKARKYLRYVDDFALFSDDRDWLKWARGEIEAYLATLRLRIHPIKSQIFATHHGANFLGFRVFPHQIRVRSANLRRARRRMRRLQRAYGKGQVDLADVVQRLQSWEAHLKYGDTAALREAIFGSLWFVREEEGRR